MTDDELTESEHAALDTWAPLTPPAGFANRVLAARAAAPAPRRRWPLVAAGLAGMLAAAAVAIVVLRAPSHAARGELVAPAARTTASLGDRGVAVAEAEAALAWRIDDDGDAEIEQRTGNVFYRVEPGGSFVVHTPAGDVRVTGTCFRIEVPSMNRTQQLLLSGTVGAAVATGIVVTVYEGHVRAEAPGGTHTNIVAGNRATLYPDGRAVIAAADAPDGAPTAIALDERTTTREQLLARAQVQQQELTKLRARVAELEAGRAVTVPSSDAEPGRAWHDPSPERLKEWVAECHIRGDEPGLDRWGPQRSLGNNERGLEPSELPQVNAALSELQQQWKQLVRSLYIEATGDTQGADTLTSEAMRREIEERSEEGEHNRLLQRIALERAGLAQPPADLSNATPFERMFRAYLELGDQAEQAIAKRLGDERAKAIRGDAWGSRSDWSGCPSQP